MNCAIANHNRVKNNFNLNKKSGCDGTSLKRRIVERGMRRHFQKVKKEKKIQKLSVFSKEGSQQRIPGQENKWQYSDEMSEKLEKKKQKYEIYFKESNISVEVVLTNFCKNQK